MMPTRTAGEEVERLRVLLVKATSRVEQTTG